eukprot:TRINITY_DN6653_c0_g1_i1.p1 TRINITY_DN6653_c0_g1~~TRINITY_DN6653_c0_g1_i1.p1  ORF type:complete len:181 (+),score=42.40 TRINITY_DN6653_c0_g1_i1:230-772(+)
MSDAGVRCESAQGHGKQGRVQKPIRQRQPRARSSVTVCSGVVLVCACMAWMSWICFTGLSTCRQGSFSTSSDSRVTRQFMSMPDPAGRDRKSRLADVAAAIGKDAAKRRSKMTSKADIEKARQLELKRKIAILRGKKGAKSIRLEDDQKNETTGVAGGDQMEVTAKAEDEDEDTQKTTAS